MKNKFIILEIISIFFLFGCKDLDQDIITTMTFDQVTKSYDYTNLRCKGVYWGVKTGFLYIDNQAMLSSATDESDFSIEKNSIYKFNVGSWNAYDNPDNIWTSSYQGIRRANMFLESADSVDLDLYKYDPTPSTQLVYQSRLADIKTWKYEVRFLRAFYYFELLKRYGGVPLFTSTVNVDKDISNIKRNTLSECIQFVSDECDSAASVLPLIYPLEADLGRATKGATLALKSRLLLYAASDLFNSPGLWAPNYEIPTLISVTGDRKTKWEAAANAAKALIDLNGTNYSLSSYSSLFGSTNFNNSEVIFRRTYGNVNDFEKINTPIGYDLGQGGTNPSQNLVDEYEVIVNSSTSVPFDWNNPTHSANPYANRDPRLAMTILTNGTVIKSRPIETWYGGLDGKPIDRATKTGYYLKKYNDTSLDLVQGKTSMHSWVVFRLAEMYLNYAEALNEADPGNADIKKYIDLVRKRSGVNMPALPTGLSQSQMRDAIRHERRIEFAFEDHRFWDVRRWMLGEEYFNTPLKGVEITKKSIGTFNYNVIEVEKRVFEPKMYLYPIPQSELYVAKGLVQNPLW